MPLVACSDDDDNGDNGDSGQKGTSLTVYQQLQSAADKSLTVDDIVSSESFTVFTLSDNSKIELQRRNNVVNLESEESKNVFSLIKGPKNTWVLGGKDLQIPVVTALSANPVVVCVTFDKNVVTVYLDNGDTIVINRSGEEEIFSFVLEADKNKDLDEDISAVINGNSAYIVLPEMASSEALVLSFGYRGVSVKIGEIIQESGVTVNDFAAPLTYSLIKQDGSKIDYTVTVKSVPRIPRIYINTENEAEIKDKENYVKSVVRIEDRPEYEAGEILRGECRRNPIG